MNIWKVKIWLSHKNKKESEIENISPYFTRKNLQNKLAKMQGIQSLKYIGF